MAEYSLWKVGGAGPREWAEDPDVPTDTTDPELAWFTEDEGEADGKAAQWGADYIVGPRPPRPH